MTVMHLVLILALTGAAVAVLAFAWSVRTGQLDDVDTPPHRILLDDEPASHVRRAPVSPPPRPMSPR